MPIRRRLTKEAPVRKDTGLRVLAMLVSAGHPRNLCQRCIGKHTGRLMELDQPDNVIVAAQLDLNVEELIVMVATGDLRRFDVSESV